MVLLRPEDLKKILSLMRLTLKENEDYLNSLNVFPVPDGDTGTNMYSTVSSGLQAVNSARNSSLQEILSVFVRETVMGARGNSGVILAQYLAGVRDILEKSDYLSFSTVSDIFDHATEEAINAIGDPVEGTILTVMEDVRDAVKDRTFDSIKELSEFIVDVANESLKRTPDLLPILKEAGVVDAGGQGFCLVLEAIDAYLTGKKTKILEAEVDKTADVWHEKSFYRFCINVTMNPPVLDVKEKLKGLGDSLVVGREKELVKVHIHSNNPPLVLERCKNMGNIIRVQINDMDKEQRMFLGEDIDGLSVIAYGEGEGIKDILKSMGVSVVLTDVKSPSIGEIVEAVEKNGKKAIILPNDHNIIPAAKKAKQLSNIECEVIETRSVPEGLAALLSFREDGDLDEVINDMKNAIKNIICSEIKWAVRDVKIGGITIKKGNAICVKNKKLISVSGDPINCLLESISKLIEEHSLITVYYGKVLEEQTFKNLSNQIKKKFPSVEVQLYFGGMANSYYMFSLE